MNKYIVFRNSRVFWRGKNYDRPREIRSLVDWKFIYSFDFGVTMSPVHLEQSFDLVGLAVPIHVVDRGPGRQAWHHHYLQ